MKRCFDAILAVIAGVILSVPMLLVALLIKLTSKGPVLYWSDRVGRNNILFKMPKFRTMKVGTPSLATHLMKDPEKYLTPIGGFLRRSSLDELPQLVSILKGDMSFVGPRPALYNQEDLIGMRTYKGIHVLLPGLTGWAQVNGRDDLPIPLKVVYDEHYLRNHPLSFDFKILFITAWQAFKGKGIKH